MFSPFQHLQRDPSSVRWEQAAYASLASMDQMATPLRKMQAAQWFESGNWRKSSSIAPHRWAEAFAKRASYLCFAKYEYAFNDGSVPENGLRQRKPVENPTAPLRERKTYSLDIQALSIMARIQNQNARTTKRSSFLQSHVERIIVALGRDDPLARGMVMVCWPASAQIGQWRRYFPEDPLADLLGVAVEMNSISPPNLEGYLLTRKGLVRAQNQGISTLDLSMLAESSGP